MLELFTPAYSHYDTARIPKSVTKEDVADAVLEITSLTGAAAWAHDYCALLLLVRCEIPYALHTAGLDEESAVHAAQCLLDEVLMMLAGDPEFHTTALSSFFGLPAGNFILTELSAFALRACAQVLELVKDAIAQLYAEQVGLCSLVTMSREEAITNADRIIQGPQLLRRAEVNALWSERKKER